MKSDLTANYIRSALDYDQDTGAFTWRKRPREHFATQRAWNRCNARFPGTEAGTVDAYGYSKISVGHVDYLAHRLAWLYMTGEWPAAQIDHINCDKLDNRFCNLRQATNAENIRNSRKPSTNTSGLKGVSWHKPNNKWRVQISANGSKRHLGYFDEDKLDEAAAAYERAAKALHGEFARVS